ncbi:hypothetical protein [Luteimonas cucumeris]|uniref:hypothetical protein n=1 Tax=Luteimonas cucumeris TaxID=985012 RepID=UPI0011A3A9A9|nr:hypothetical protein [Luteimonas cucumeris]
MLWIVTGRMASIVPHRTVCLTPAWLDEKVLLLGGAEAQAESRTIVESATGKAKLREIFIASSSKLK